MSAPLPHATLKAKQRELRQGFPETMGLRVHRSISWIGRAEAARRTTTPGSSSSGSPSTQPTRTSRSFRDRRLASGRPLLTFSKRWSVWSANQPDPKENHDDPGHDDAERRIYNDIWEGFAGPIRVLMQNRYVFNPFWQHHNGIEGYEDWEKRFEASWAGAFARSFAAQDTARTLSFVFDRLYVLRNQLVHGGATWNSAVNRDQVRDGASILESFSCPSSSTS